MINPHTPVRGLQFTVAQNVQGVSAALNYQTEVWKVSGTNVHDGDSHGLSHLRESANQRYYITTQADTENVNVRLRDERSGGNQCYNCILLINIDL